MVKTKPYVGVTGPVSREEVTGVGEVFRDAVYTNSTFYRPMIGILVSHKTLQGQPTNNRRYPKFREVPALLEEAAKYGMPVIHYNSRDRETLGDQFAQMLADCKACQGIQLNIPWPDPITVRGLKRLVPNFQIIIQLSASAMDGLSPEGIAKKVKEYGEAADYALIDPSGGKGKEFDLKNSLAVYQALRAEVPKTTIGFAGGFTKENVKNRLESLMAATLDDFCIDAEGGLRDKVTQEYGDDLLNMQKVKGYIEEARKVLS